MTTPPRPPVKIIPTAAVPAFTPVPRQRMRRGGWSAQRQRDFIDLLAETGSVRAACRRMGVGEHHIYKLRNHPQAGEFRRAWEAALDLGIARIEDIAMDRAMNGVETPVYHAGEIVGQRRVYNDRLLMFLLNNRAPKRFAVGANGGRGSGGPDAVQIESLKKKWRRQWEAEQEAQNVDPAEVRRNIDKALENVRSRLKDDLLGPLDKLTDEARAAWEHFKSLRNRDRAAAEQDRKRTGGSPNWQDYKSTPAPPEAEWTAIDEGFDP